MPGARCTRSLVCKVLVAHECSHHRSTGTPGIPARNGFNSLCRALPGDRAFLPPSSADKWLVRARLGRHAFRELDASVGASGPHDFAVRSQHLSSARLVIAHRPFDPPCDPLARKTLPRPSHPAPNVRDDRDTPLLWDGMRKVLDVIWGAREPKFFANRPGQVESKR
jgi:hypothetical protein